MKISKKTNDEPTWTWKRIRGMKLCTDLMYTLDSTVKATIALS